MLIIEAISKHFSGSPVVSDVDLTVPENGFTVMIGPSGCGKSTFFDLLMGALPMDAGSIRWRGAAVPDLSRLAAYMQQSDLLLPWLGLADNARLPADIAGDPVARSGGRVQRLFDRLGLAGFEAHLPSMVSGGMRQRCALARTLMFGRDLVLLDEPLSALDAITRRSLQQMLRLLQTDFKKTILMVTHDIDEALLLADELLVLSPPPMQVTARMALQVPQPRCMENPQLVAIKHRVLAMLQEERPS
ncbi:ABC transporter ATP-binding protein [Desulfosarcina alkanivorans]|uniref:ABC transporter ATP-binding protein n=1 Tax=Desulfosarcina alkanivorans TaxID=571177 RepID=A0A5K7YW82_9BACT|nr:ABC transporter ATP-binding protein [Desulfosarcina alkanivorans]BBO71341.1 ABC transporter ATP-binding protein [Desulfosarcina alkanivorans]